MAKEKPPTRKEILEMIQQSFTSQMNEHAVKEREATRADIKEAFESYLAATKVHIELAIRTQTPAIAGKAFYDVLHDPNIEINHNVNRKDSIVGHITYGIEQNAEIKQSLIDIKEIIHPLAEKFMLRKRRNFVIDVVSDYLRETYFISALAVVYKKYRRQKFKTKIAIAFGLGFVITWICDRDMNSHAGQFFVWVWGLIQEYLSKR